MHVARLPVRGGFGRVAIPSRGVRGGLGKLVCGSGDCDAARSRVAALRSLLEDLVTRGKVQRPTWEPAVVAIEAAAEEADPWIEAFNCCALYEVGRRADELAARLARAGGVAAPGQAGEGNEVNWLGWGIAAGVVLVLLAIYGAMRLGVH